MSDFLFSEFNEVSAKAWKQKIQVDLKGADYNDTLIWKNLEGIDVKPFYHQDDLKNDYKKENVGEGRTQLFEFTIKQTKEVVQKEFAQEVAQSTKTR